MKLLGGRGVLVVALGLGALTSFLVWQYVQEAGQAARPRPTVPVVVALEPIPARAVITSEMLRVQQLPTEARHPDAFRSAAEAVGKISRAAMTPGEQVLSSKVFLQREESGLSFAIPEGMRAVSVSVTEVIGSGGLVLPGDRVDVLGVFETKAKDEDPTYLSTMVLQDVEILAIAQRLEGQDTRDTQTRLAQEAQGIGSGAAGASPVRAQATPLPQAKTATLAVSPSDSLRLVLAEERGKIRLALRRAKDATIAEVGRLPLASLTAAGEQAPLRAASASPTASPLRATTQETGSR